MEINGELLEHALDGLGLLEPDAEGKLGPLGAEGHTAGPDIRPPDPVLQTIIHNHPYNFLFFLFTFREKPGVSLS
jgi:hypothetical protein